LQVLLPSRQLVQTRLSICLLTAIFIAKERCVKNNYKNALISTNKCFLATA
jgi:hypothetical protein